jgi:hypothetical protein
MWWAALYVDDVIRTQTRLAIAVAAIVQSSSQHPAEPT